MRMRSEKGNAMVEFALASFLVLIPMFLGMVWSGISLGRGIQITQITRDAGHMYAKNIDFSAPANKDIVVRLALGTSMTRDGGNGVVLLSQIMKVYDADCAAASLDAATCTNLGKTVFAHRVTIGNTGLTNGQSRFGTPSPVNSDGSVPNYLTNAAAVATNFDRLLALQQGEVAYVAEGYLSSPDITFATGQAGVYAYSIF